MINATQGNLKHTVNTLREHPENTYFTDGAHLWYYEKKMEDVVVSLKEYALFR